MKQKQKEKVNGLICHDVGFFLMFGYRDEKCHDHDGNQLDAYEKQVRKRKYKFQEKEIKRVLE